MYILINYSLYEDSDLFERGEERVMGCGYKLPEKAMREWFLFEDPKRRAGGFGHGFSSACGSCRCSGGSGGSGAEN